MTCATDPAPPDNIYRPSAPALITPLTATHPYLASGHLDLAARVDDLTRHTDRLRRRSGKQRRNRD
jgi:hypothetical protein